MPEISHYDTGTPCWVDLSTTDVDGALAFYRQVFDWEAETVPTDAGPDYHFLRCRGQVVAGLGPQPPEQAQAGVPPTWTTYLAAPVDDTSAKAEAAGGSVMMPGMDVMKEGRMAIVADPTGAATGLWEARDHHGATLVNEPGAVVWNELNTHDIDASGRWLQAVFGVTLDDVPDTPNPYRTFAVDGQVRGGILQMGSDMARFPSHWMTYFGADDAGAVVDRVSAAGGTVNVAPWDTPFGRMAVLSDPQGAVFMISQQPDG